MKNSMLNQLKVVIVNMLLLTCSGLVFGEALVLEAEVLGEWVDSNINESSGVAQSGYGTDVFWTHNDNKQNWVSCARRDGTKLGRLYFNHSRDNVRDPEDFAVGPGPDPQKSYLYYGDVGDNYARRTDGIYVLRAVEPDVTEPFGKMTVESDSLHFVYPDGPRDCEAMFVDPLSKDIYFVGKHDKRSKVHVARYPYAVGTPVTLEYLGTLPAPAGRGITGADITSDGRKIIMCKDRKDLNQIHFHLWRRGENQSVFEALSQRPQSIYTNYSHRKREGVCWAYDGAGFYATTEGVMNLNYCRTLEALSAYPDDYVAPAPESPSVSVVEPNLSDGIIEGSDVVFKAEATANSGMVTLVRVIMDGITIAEYDTPSVVHEGLFSDLVVGEHKVSLKVFNSEGGGTLEHTKFTVHPRVNVPPVVNFELPEDITQGDALNLNISATDSDGSIRTVKVYLDGSLVQELTEAPFTVENIFDGVDPGEHTVTVEVYDTDGSTAQCTQSFVIAAAPPIEAGRIEINHEWKRVEFAAPINNPVVVVSPLSYNGTHGAFARVRNVTETGFEVQVAEWDYLDGSHALERVSYLAVEAGVHEVGGLTIQAFVIDADNKNAAYNYHEPFETVPVVLSTVCRTEGTIPTVPYMTNVDEEGFVIKLNSEEALWRTPVTDQIQVIAIEQGISDDATIKSSLTDEIYNHNTRTLEFGGQFVDPLFFAVDQSGIGNNTTVIRWVKNSLTESSVDILIQEEQSKDEEINHAQEAIGWLVIDLL